MARIIMHIDLNAFFATCEEIEDPSCVGKPLAVAGTDKRGIVLTANYEARKYGVHSAMPTYLALKKCPQLIIKPGNFKLYSLMSNEFFSFVRKYTKIIEIASIDECYADLTDVLKNCNDVMKYLKNMQYELYRQTKLKCSIGIGPTKFMAKMASDMKKPMGITILRKKDIPTKLWPLPIEDMFGVGKKSAPRFRKLGINTIGDLVNKKSSEIDYEKDKMIKLLISWATGNGSDEVITEYGEQKSLGHAHTFMEDTNDYEQMSNLIKELSLSVSNEAKRKKLMGYGVQVTIRDNDFNTINRSKTFKNPFNDFETIYHTAMKILEANYHGELIRLLGVTLQNLVDEKELNIQMTFDNYYKYEEENLTKLLINELNRKMKSNIFTRASEVKKEK
ncbi:MAG: DNA polymerase IV [Bacilli bacterium]|nr:DNA polymerase IV [Bacilli bacterium]